ncbi:hypothetical protein E2562_026242 [Oryza meyeriana var. granulata]|uniref:Uncharacterized protein n=1 Tax=Oryza meyeriana var. granulata TaxID=110450 RepID=A0A6G1CIN2_9ORYZ|nr:hypothetical protein E2562_026242 [Oryza meyeriana var. granulata]
MEWSGLRAIKCICVRFFGVIRDKACGISESSQHNIRMFFSSIALGLSPGRVKPKHLNYRDWTAAANRDPDHMHITFLWSTASSSPEIGGHHGFAPAVNRSNSSDGEAVSRPVDRPYGWGQEGFTPFPWIPADGESHWWGTFNPMQNHTHGGFSRRPAGERMPQSHQDSGYQPREVKEILESTSLCDLVQRKQESRHKKKTQAELRTRADTY